MIPIHNKEVKSPICLICYSKSQINQKQHQPLLKVPDEFHSIFKYMKIVAEVILIPIHSEGIGYGILFGVGLVIAIMVTMLARTESKWLGTKKTFGWYYTAGRNVKSGLFAASVVSSWKWAATILQSSSVAYQFGISVPLLVGNIMSISISGAISVLGSLLKPEDFNFSVMKQKIAVV